jgi:hypothetical protein
MEPVRRLLLEFPAIQEAVVVRVKQEFGDADVLGLKIKRRLRRNCMATLIYRHWQILSILTVRSPATSLLFVTR